MPRRIEIELTSQSADKSWTWRAAGAKEPRGTLDSSLVPDGSLPGAVFSAQVESGLEGIEIVSIVPSGSQRSSTQGSAERITMIGPSRLKPGVTVSLSGGQKTGSKAPRSHASKGRGGTARPPKRDWNMDESSTTQRRERRGRSGSQDLRTARRPVSMTHRNAVLATLPPEQLPIAEQLLRGGMPSVRRAIEEQNAQLKASGDAPIAPDALLEMAETLWPAIRLGEWKDRATSAGVGASLSVRELRSLVAASRAVILDEEGKAMAKSLQEDLTAQLARLRDMWVSEISAALDSGDVLSALRISSAPPEPGTRCPSDLAVRLSAMAGEAMTDELHEEDWFSLLDAVVASPIKRTVKPKGIPIGEGVKPRVMSAAGSVPALARLLGVRVPPPPPVPTKTAKSTRKVSQARHVRPRGES